MALSPFDYAFWISGFLFEVLVVVCSAYRKEFLRYFAINFFMLATALVSVVDFIVSRQYGRASEIYVYVYYYTESLLTISLYFVIMGFYRRTLEEMKVSRYVRGATVLLLACTAAFSYLVVRQNNDHLTGRFVVELGQNLHFVGVVLTYVLWGTLLKVRETRTRLVQLVLAIGVYVSATAATYALRNLFPGLESAVLRFIPPMLGTFLPLAWAYTFFKVPEDARLMPARLLARAR
jgi:hypothetical protein